MTIKSKLIANILLTAAIIIGISWASFSSMSFFEEKLSYIAKKSTPLQMRTVEFQRELQICITDLVKVSTARTVQDFATFRGEAARSLGNVRISEQILERMNSGIRMGVADELARISDELLTATEARIKSDSAADEANKRVSQQMKESSSRLKELEARVRNLQITQAASFAKALEDTDRFSSRLKDLEELRSHIKELHSLANSAHNSGSSALFIIRSKARTLTRLISSHKSGTFIATDLKVLGDDMNEFLQLQSTAAAQKDADSRRWALESLQALAESVNSINLALNQEIEFASAKLEIEANRQGFIFAQSRNANDILLTNSELVALGLTATGEINRLFNADSSSELETAASEIRSLFASLQTRAQAAEKSLARFGAGSELYLLRSAVASLSAISSKLSAPDGIVAALKLKLNADEQAKRAAEKLNAIAAKQSAKGKESVTAVQKEQDTLIAAVHDMLGRSLSRIFAVGSATILIGVFFGFWIYRSVMPPLRLVIKAMRQQQERGEEKARLAGAIAGGDLNREVIVSESIELDPSDISKDEMGLVLKAVAGMSEAQVTLDRAFAAMTTALRISRDETAKRDRLKSGLHQLDDILRGEQNTTDLANRTLAFIATFLGAGVGIMYRYDETDETLYFFSGYAVSRSEQPQPRFRLGEGVPGQVALERRMICLDSLKPDHYLPIASALGSAEALHVAVVPIIHHDTLIGVLELGSFRPFGSDDFDFMTRSLEAVAIAINVNHSRQLVDNLLEQSQRQTEELRVQQEELQQNNEELEERNRMVLEHQNKPVEVQ